MNYSTFCEIFKGWARMENDFVGHRFREGVQYRIKFAKNPPVNILQKEKGKPFEDRLFLLFLTSEGPISLKLVSLNIQRVKTRSWINMRLISPCCDSFEIICYKVSPMPSGYLRRC